MKKLSDNLSRELTRAVLLVSTLPLTTHTRAALMGDCAVPFNVIPLRIPRDTCDIFSLACEKAFIRVLNEQSASLTVSPPFDWTLHLLVAGAKPSFLFGKLNSSKLAAAARVLKLTDPQCLPIRFGDLSEMAALEKDELTQLASQAAPHATARARL